MGNTLFKLEILYVCVYVCVCVCVYVHVCASVLHRPVSDFH